jgi:hypothetical protein
LIRSTASRCSVVIRDAPLDAVAGERHRDVVALVAALAGRAARTPLVVAGERDDAGDLDQAGQQAQHVPRRAVRADQAHDVEVAPGHQAGHVAPGQRQRPEHRAQLGQQRGRLGLECGLPGQQLIVRGHELSIPTQASRPDRAGD